MFTKGFGEVITDILTINPAIRQIPTASAILDTSNYTFNSITLGKDGHGFKFHAHTLNSESGGVYNNGYVLVTVRNTLSPSSYHSSATHAYFSSTYSSVPSYPSVYDTRLERASTLSNASITIDEADYPDLGHYVNAAIDSSLSSIWNVVGSYPPSGNSGKYMLLNSSGGFIVSGNLSGVFNTQGIVDKKGYIKIAEANASSTTVTIANGPYLSIDSTTFSSVPTLRILVSPRLGDAAALAAFGGVNHIGIWCLDIKSMLADGLTPPYSWNNINNTRKYKLVGKVTMWNDLLHHEDITALGLSGYKTLLVEGNNDTGLLGPAFILSIRF